MLCFSCATKQSTNTASNKIESTSKIIFLNYAIEKASNGTRNISYLNKIVTDGKLKIQKNTLNEVGILGDLECFQLDKKSNILQRTLIKNPLAKTIEYLNESKSFQTKTIDLDNTNFSVRLQLESNTKYISIFELGAKEANLKPLISTKLN